MASPADGYKTLSQILSVNQMQEKRLANIEKALTGKDNKKGLDVKSAAGGGGADKFSAAMLKNSNAQLQALQNIQKLLGGGSGVDKIKGFFGGGGDGKATGATALNAVGLMKAVRMYGVVGKAVADEFIQFLVSFFKVFEDIDEKKVKAGGEAFEKIAMYSGKMIKTLFLLRPMVTVAQATAKGMISLANSLVEAFSKFDKKAVDNAHKAAKTIGIMGLSLLMITGVLVIVGMAVMAMGTEIAAGVALVAGIAALFYLIGMGDNKIKDGARAITMIGLSMIALAAGFYFFALGISEAGKIIGGGAGSFVLGLVAGIGTVALLATLYFFAGTVSKEILEGALAFAAIGVSLIILSFGLERYFGVVAKIFGMNNGDGGGSIGGALGGVFGGIVTSVGGIMLLLAVGTVFALAGLFEFGIPVMIMWGALAFATIGVSLMILTPALEYFFNTAGKILGTKSDSGENKDLMSNGAIGQVFGGVATTIGGLSLLLMTGAIFALAGIASPLIGLGALAMWGAGQALISVADGITYYNEKVGDDKIAKNLKSTLMGISEAFIAFVGGENKDGGVWGAIKGAVSGIATGSQLSVAISSAMGIGPALTSIATGVGAWANLQKIPRIKGYDKMGQPIFDDSKTADVEQALQNITEYLPGIVQPFIDVSKQANMKKGSSLFSLISGADLGESPFEEGVRVSGMIGPTLSSLAAGIGIYANLAQAPMFKGYDAKGQPIFDDSKVFNVLDAIPQIGETLTAVIEPFISLSKRANMGKSTSLFSLISGADLGESPFEQGVRVAGMIGPTLSSLAGGIGVYANLAQAPKFKGYDTKGQPIFDDSKVFDVLASMPNIVETFEAVIEPFITLANNSALKVGTSLFSLISGADLGESPFERGVNIVGQIGPVLTSLAGGIGTFANLSQAPKITGYDELGQPIYSKGEVFDVLGSIANITSVIDPDSGSSVVQPLIDLGNYLEDSQPFSIGGFLFKAITGGSLGQSPAERGMAFALQIGRVLTEIGNGLGVFVNLQNIPELSGYDKDGHPIYSGKTVDSSIAIRNVGFVLSDIIQVLGDNAEELGDLENIEELQGVGPFVGQILNAISSSLEVFANTDKIKLITGYDSKTGRAIYSPNEFVSLDNVVDNMIYTVKTIIGAFATDEMEDLMDELDIDDDEFIGKFIADFAKPLQTFGKIEGEFKAQGGIRGMADKTVYAVNSLVEKFAYYEQNDWMSDAMSSAYKLEGIVDIMSGDVYDMFEDYTELDGAKFKDNMTDIFYGIHKLSTINGASKKKESFFSQFVEETKKLSSIASPFSKFVTEFGKFAKHMGVFKENFSFMNPEGIMAFEKWTGSVEHLVITAKENGVTGGGMLDTIIEKTNGLISTAFGSEGGGPGTDMTKDKKKEAIDKANKPADGSEDKSKKDEMAGVIAAIQKLEKSIANLAFPSNVIAGNSIRIVEEQ